MVTWGELQQGADKLCVSSSSLIPNSMSGMEKACKAASKQVFLTYDFHGQIYPQNLGEH